MNTMLWDGKKCDSIIKKTYSYLSICPVLFPANRSPCACECVWQYIVEYSDLTISIIRNVSE